MSREKFQDVNFRGKSKELILHCQKVVTDYLAQGLRLTLRQLYYQLVSKNIIENKERSYKNLSSLVSDARLAGLLDWEAIEDRIRKPHRNSEFTDLGQLCQAALAAYRLPRWEGQDNYVELWVEKDALAGVLAPLAEEFHVTMMVNRGYSSQSAMYESANRFKNSPRDGILFYLGDHDPSGEDMVRDIRDRFDMFGASVEVTKLALTMDQIEEHNPPPNPAKVNDPRADAYIAEHGASSWEVDALPPELLSQIITKALESVIDREMMDAIIEQEETDKLELTKAVEKILKKNKKGK
jgi:hypothetical protein